MNRIDPLAHNLVWHYWDAPDPTGRPATTTVVIKSRCGKRLSLPAWQVQEWDAKGAPIPSITNACPTCLSNTPEDERPAA